MAKRIPSIQEVRKILGTYSIAPVRNWLKRNDLTHTMNSREAMVERVHDLLKRGELEEDEVIEAAIGIEEASSKRVFLYKILHDAESLAKIDSQLAALQVPLSEERTPSVTPTVRPKLIYALNNEHRFRAKWNELHVRTTADKRKRKFVDINVPKVIVCVVNKTTGEVQLRYDKPDGGHTHLEEGEASDEVYFDYYKQKVENYLGLALEPIDFRVGLERILKTEPRIVKTNYTVDDAEDGTHTRRTQKKAGKDIRDTEEWKRIASDRMVRTFEEAPLTWVPEVSGGKLKRELFSYVDAANGFVRFDANCYEDEISYVLEKLAKANAAANVA